MNTQADLLKLGSPRGISTRPKSRCSPEALFHGASPWSTPHGRDESLRVRTHSTGQAKEGAPADSGEEMKDFTGVDP